MAVVLPIVGIPLGITAAYYSWKLTYKETCKVFGGEKQRTNIVGAMIGTSFPFIFSAALALHNSRNSPVVSPAKKVPYTTTKFLSGSRKMIAIGSLVWCASAVTAGIGSCILGTYTPENTDAY